MWWQARGVELAGRRNDEQQRFHVARMIFNNQSRSGTHDTPRLRTSSVERGFEVVFGEGVPVRPQQGTPSDICGQRHEGEMRRHQRDTHPHQGI